jgi:hypothetical protein
VTTWAAVSVTGHRDLTDAATGMALGADTEFGWAALHAGLQLHAHIPFPEQADRWPAEDQATYRRLLERCTTKTVYGPRYDPRWFFARNQSLIDFAAEHAGVLVAVWNPARHSGGTFDAVQRAAGVVPVIHLNPSALGRAHGPDCSHLIRPQQTGL